ncbi:MAG: DUF2141 domain-containing protein [Sphingopyxis sp.]|nr:DUF2141 domain-containing protein [Sphingopyxis sp.]
MAFQFSPLRAALAAAGAGALITGTVVAANTLGPHAARCDSGSASVIVNVTGFRERTGTVRVQLYAANPRTFLERRAWLQRVDVPVTRSGDMPICVPVSAPGRYAISVRHDANGNGSSDRSDGGGFSGNPDVSLLDMALRRKPSLDRVGFNVGSTPVRTNVILNYVQGTRFDPLPRN